LANQTKLKYWLNPYDDELVTKVYNFIRDKLPISTNPKYKVYFKEICKAFSDVPPSLLYNIMVFIVDNQGFYLDYSPRYDDFVVRRFAPRFNTPPKLGKPRSTREKIFRVMMAYAKLEDELGSVTVEEVLKKCEEQGIDKDDAKRLINYLLRDGVFYSPDGKLLKRLGK
jgi:hypothetical protein